MSIWDGGFEGPSTEVATSMLGRDCKGGCGFWGPRGKLVYYLGDKEALIAAKGFEAEFLSHPILPSRSPSKAGGEGTVQQGSSYG